MLSALSNVFQVPELRSRIIFTLIMFAVFRLGTHIPVPGVDPSAIERLFHSGSLFGLLDLFSGGAFSKFSIFAMSITPYINAAIIMQLLSVVIPTLEQWSKEGADGHKKTSRITRQLAVVLAFFQAIGMSIGLKAAILNPSPVNIFIIALSLTAGTTFLMWIGEQISSQGVGNGISLIIFAGIVSALPSNFATIYQYLHAGTVNYFSVLLFAIIAVAMIVLVVYVETGYRRIPVTYSKRVTGSRVGAGSFVDAHSSHIPLKVNQAGVIPIIFASSVLMFPTTIIDFVDNSSLHSFAELFRWGSYLHSACYVLLIIFFTYFYTAVSVKINDISDYLNKFGAFIPGIRPGSGTSLYLSFVLDRLTFVGAAFLALIAILPNAIAGATNIHGVYFGGTALLIVVSVALHTMKHIDSFLIFRHYDGFIK